MMRTSPAPFERSAGSRRILGNVAVGVVRLGVSCLLLTVATASLAGQGKDIKDLTFDDLKFEMKKGERFKDSMLTQDILDLEGQVIRVRGFIRPSLKQKGIAKFVFVRDNQECCFGPGAMLYDCILVQVEKGKELDFTVRPITIEGKFYIKKFKGPDDKVWAIFRMKEAQKR